MTLTHFLDERASVWGELEELVRAAGRRSRGLDSDRVLRLGELYRSAAADLAVARQRWPGDPAVRRLDELVARARHLVYAAPHRRLSALGFFATGYWRLVAARPLMLAVSALLLFAPAALAAGWAVDDPGAAGGLVPAQYRSVAEPRTQGTDLGLSADEEAGTAAEIFTNNIRVTFGAFAGGITGGVLTAAVLLFNGVLLGAVAGLAWGAGNSRPFVELVVAHGVLELSCIVVAGAAGLRLGWALIAPGRLPRGLAVGQEARRAVLIALGTAPWLVVAGLVEGFLTPSGLGLARAIAIGACLGTVYWSLVLWRGALTDGREPSL
ncbi:MAG: stage II sporulation protein M [Actinobacteria bacterium]|nr:MAG: stage II sporulation protein M [Actinomycetota bacterium]TML70335.1 MAG: stage II sporulation protein M [Actinomycetota bacterium]